MSARLHQDDHWPRPSAFPTSPLESAPELRLVEAASPATHTGASRIASTTRFAAWTLAICLLTIGPGAFAWEGCRIGGEAVIAGLFAERLISEARRGTFLPWIREHGAWSGLALSWMLVACAAAGWGIITGWGTRSPYPEILYNGGESGPLRQLGDTCIALMGFFAVSAQGRQKSSIRHIAPILIAAAATLALCVLEAVRNRVAGASDPRLEATFTNPNLLGAFLCIALPACIGAALDCELNRITRISASFLATGSGWALWMSGSRGALLGCVAALAFLSLHWAAGKVRAAIRRDPTTRLRLAPAAALILLLTLLPVIGRVSKHFSSGGGAHVASDDQRRVAWEGARIIIGEHSLTGLGLGSYPAALGALQLRQINPATATGLPLIPAMHLHAHDLILEFWAERGPAGLALACALVGATLIAAFSCLKRGGSSLQAIGCAAMLATLTQNIADYTLWYAPLLILFWQLPPLMMSGETADNQ